MKIVNHTFDFHSKKWQIAHYAYDFQISMEDAGEEEGFVICRIEEGFPLTEKVKTVGLREFLFGII